MNTKTLVVGQEVYLLSGDYIQQGKVVEVTSCGVKVQTTDELLGFDTEGKACSSDKGVFAWEPEGRPGTYECGPWYLDDIPFAERKELLRKAKVRQPPSESH